jgi:anti-sigma factor RsiW
MCQLGADFPATMPAVAPSGATHRTNNRWDAMRTSRSTAEHQRAAVRQISANVSDSPPDAHEAVEARGARRERPGQEVARMLRTASRPPERAALPGRFRPSLAPSAPDHVAARADSETPDARQTQKRPVTLFDGLEFSAPIAYGQTGTTRWGTRRPARGES